MIYVTLVWPSDDDLTTSMHTTALTAAQRAAWESAGITVQIWQDFNFQYLCDESECEPCRRAWSDIAEQSLLSA